MKTTMQNNNEKKVIALYRVSTKMQDYTRQETDLNRVIAIDGYTPEQVIPIGKKESGVCLSMDEREGIREMKQAIETENVVAVYVHELSRLSRRVADTFMLRDYLMQHHVQLICLNPTIKCFTEDWKIDPTANMIFGIMASMAENEGYLRKERLAGGKAQRKAKGLFAGGKPSYGYVMPDKRKPIEIDPKTAPVVERIFKMYTEEQKSTMQIGEQLFNEGLFGGCKSLASARNKVSEILKNTDYLGNNIYPMLISTVTFNKAQEKLSQQYTKPRKCYDGNVYLGHGLLYYDKRAMMPRKDVGTYVFNARYRGGKESCYINIDFTDAFILQLTDEFLHAPLISDNTAILEQYNAKVAEYKRMVETKKTHIATLVENKDKITEKELLNQLSEKRADTMRQKIDEEIRETEKTIADIESKAKDLLNVIADMNEQKVIDVYALQPKEQQEIVKRCIEKIGIEKVKHGTSKLTVTYKPNVAGTMADEVYIFNSMKHRVWQVDGDIEREIIIKGYTNPRTMKQADTTGMLTAEQARAKAVETMEKEKAA